MSFANTAKRHATTIILSTLAASAALYVFVIDRGSVTTQEAELRKRNLFSAWRVDDISTVTIERSGKTATLTHRAPDARGQRFWDINLDKDRFAAEEQQVDQFLGTLEFSTYERVVEPGSVEASVLGLEQPRLRVSVTLSDRPTVVTIGGNASSPPGAVFAEVKNAAGTRLYVLNKELVAALDTDPELLRARKLVPYPSTDIARFEIVAPTFTYHLEHARPDGDEMRLAGPTKEAKKPVSRRAFNEFLTTLGRTDAASFLADDVADKASKPAVTITFVPKDSSRPRGVLAVGGDCPDNPEQVVAILREPSRISACLTKEVVDGLIKSPDTLVDRGLFAATIDEVEEVSFTSGDKRLELARKGTNFHQRVPIDRDVDASAGRAVLEALFALRGSDVVVDPDRAALGLDKPIGTIRLTSLLPSHADDGGDDERIEDIIVGPVRGEELAVSRGKDGAVLTLPASALRDLFPSDVALRSLTVIDQPETVVRALRIEQRGRIQRIERTMEGGWKLTEPTGRGLAADVGLGSDIASTLFPLKVERFVAAKDDGSFGLDKPRITVDADIGSGDAGAHSIRLLIGAPTTTGSFARIDGDDAVFIVPKIVETVTSQWLLDRAVFSFDVGDIVKVTVTQNDKKQKPLVLKRNGDALTIEGSSNASSAALLRDALGDMAPDAAVSVGAPTKEQGFDPPAFTITIERALHTDDVKDLKADPQRTVRIVFGARDVFRGREVMYARRDGIDATYVIARSKAQTFIDTPH